MAAARGRLQSFEAHAEAALASITMIEAANAEDEALAIAVALREAVEQGKTAALVTPDRALARRVNAALERWEIAAEDSGGDALADTPAGIFARLAAEAALGGLAPVTLLGLLKHPLLRLGARDNARAVAALERAILRGPRPRAGTAGLVRARSKRFGAQLAKYRAQGGVRSAPLRSAHAPFRQRTFDAAGRSGAQARRGAARRSKASATSERPLSDIAARHRDVLAALSRDGATRARLRRARRHQACRRARRIGDQRSRCRHSRIAPSDYVELFSAPLPTAWCARRRMPARACASSASWKRA